jgi:hypothetical protein
MALPGFFCVCQAKAEDGQLSLLPVRQRTEQFNDTHFSGLNYPTA